MNLTSKNIIKSLLNKYSARPFKGWGQNFLIDKQVLKKIIDSANLKKSDIVLEIGPGIGTLTLELAKRVKKVIAIEKDKKMCEILKDVLEGQPRIEPKVLVRGWGVRNVRIVNADILKIKFPKYQLQTTNYKLVANLPYYIVAPVIRKFLEGVEVIEGVEVKPLQMKPLQMTLMVQKEVAQRICAKPPDMNLLAVSVQFYSKPEILFYVPKNSFWPQPKVDSAVIKIVPRQFRVPISHQFRERFFRITKAGFSQPRKQIANNLSKMLKLNKERVKKWLLENGIDPTRRAETLSVKDWIKLTKNFKWKIQK